MSGITILSIAGILLALSNIVQSRAIEQLKEWLRSQQKLIEAWQERNEILSDILMMMGKERQENQGARRNKNERL